MSPVETYGIGFADSGVGALLFALDVYRALLPELRRIQNQFGVQFEFYHYGDSLHAPFGSKSVADLQVLTWDLVAHLGFLPTMRQVILACNTASTVVDHSFLSRFGTAFPTVKLWPIIEESVKALYFSGRVEIDSTGKKILCLGILCTQATLISQQFQRALHALHEMNYGAEGVELILVSYAPMHWASLVEQGEPLAVCRQVVLQDLRQWALSDQLKLVSAIGLFCTHFPFLTEAIRSGLLELGIEAVTLVSQSQWFVPVILEQIRREFSSRVPLVSGVPISDPLIFSEITGENREAVTWTVRQNSPDIYNRVIVRE